MKKKIVVAFVLVLQFVFLTVITICSVKTRLYGLNLQTIRFITPLSLIKFSDILIPYGLTVLVNILLCKLLKAGKHRAMKVMLGVAICSLNIVVCYVFLAFSSFEKTELYCDNYQYYGIIADNFIQDEYREIMPMQIPYNSTEKKLRCRCFCNGFSSESSEKKLIILSYTLEKNKYDSDKQLFFDKYLENKDSVSRFGTDSFSFGTSEEYLYPCVYVAFFDDEQRIIYAYKGGGGDLDERVNQFLIEE